MTESKRTYFIQCSFTCMPERRMPQIMSQCNCFSHYKQSIRVVELLEKDGKGLNLTKEVRDGIVNHRTSGNPSTLEGKVVRLSDKIAYINHDIDDAIRAKIFSEDDIPKIYTSILGNSTKTRLNTMINDIVLNSMDKNDIVMSDLHLTAVLSICFLLSAKLQAYE